MALFTSLKSYKKLKLLAENPPKINEENFVDSVRLKKYFTKTLELKLSYGFEKINDDILSELFNLAKETNAFTKMQDMQNGKVVNYIENFPSEERMALHTSLRDFFEDTKVSLNAKKAKDLAYKETLKLKLFIDKINLENKFDTIVQVGIGGSILGPKLMYDALKNLSRNNRKAYFISNLDSDEAFEIFQKIDFEKTLFVIVSKSGTTLETKTNETLIINELRKRNLTPKNHLISITKESSKMDDKSKYLEVFYIWDYICGRFSATSMVGGVLLSFINGFDDYLNLLKGANQIDKNALDQDFKNNIPLMLALITIWNRNFLGFKTQGIIPYSSKLSSIIPLIQQVEMESNGKAISKEGVLIDYNTCPINWGDIGTNAQHFIFQFLHQGTDITPLVFIGFEKPQNGFDLKVDGTTSYQKLNSNLFAQAIALAIGKKDDNLNKLFKGDRPSSIILLEKITPFSLGALIALFEHKAAFEGFILDINSFDQEGVELGKILAKEIMNIYEKKSSDFDIAKTLIDLLES